jgi:hypothetical protein
MYPLVDAREHSGLAAIANPPIRAREATRGVFSRCRKIA